MLVSMPSERSIHTIGHSTRSAAELVELLREHAIELVVDVRRFPASRRHPQFGKEALSAELRDAGIEYRHEIDLGGRRRPREDSPNAAWINDSFRGYADHAGTEEFEAALARVIASAAERKVAIMCAEAHPSRCHRRIMSDVLVARGWRVVHILDRHRSEDHALDPNARTTSEGKLVYPAEQQRRLGFEH
jgi:uncharacterized protein (DUF488 family)